MSLKLKMINGAYHFIHTHTHIGMVISPDPVGNPVHPTRTGPGIPLKNGGGDRAEYTRFNKNGAGAGAG